MAAAVFLIPSLRSDKGTTAWHGISAAGAVFPSASVNGQARCIALTPFVPLSREAGEGERAAGRTAARSYTPLPQRGRGAGGEGKKWAPPAHSEPKRCTLISSLRFPLFAGGINPTHGHPRGAVGTLRRGVEASEHTFPLQATQATDSWQPIPFNADRLAARWRADLPHRGRRAGLRRRRARTPDEPTHLQRLRTAGGVPPQRGREQRDCHPRPARLPSVALRDGGADSGRRGARAAGHAQRVRRAVRAVPCRQTRGAPRRAVERDSHPLRRSARAGDPQRRAYCGRRPERDSRPRATARATRLPARIGLHRLHPAQRACGVPQPARSRAARDTPAQSAACRLHRAVQRARPVRAGRVGTPTRPTSPV
jgi:hypothetical protein